MEYDVQSQDIIIALTLAFNSEERSYAKLGEQLGLSASQVHAAVRRSEEAGLLLPGVRKVNRGALTEFLVHGLKYVFPAKRGPVVRGMPTAHSAPPLNKTIVGDGGALVWPDSKGVVRGESIEPLHKVVPTAAKRDSSLYESLALIDAIRVGRARERKLAITKLEAMLNQ